MPELNFTSAQRSAIEHRDGALLISAGAGSGKTRVLIERLMSYIDAGADIDRFLVITYTRAAAAELRTRLSSAVSERLARNPADRHMRRQAGLIYRARINTIHAFCSDIIRENAHIALVRPDFRQLDESEADAMLNETLEDVLEGLYEQMSPEFQLLTDMLGAGRDDSALTRIVLETFAAVRSHPYPERWMAAQTEQAAEYKTVDDTPWAKLLLSRAESRTRFWLRRMEGELEAMCEDEAVSKAYLPSWQATVTDLTAFIKALEDGWDAAVSFGGVDFPRLGALRGRSGDEYVEHLKALRGGCKKAMGSVCSLFDTPGADLMADLKTVRPVTDELFRLVTLLLSEYDEAKRHRGVLDFSDLEHLALKILVDETTGGATARAGEISRRFDEILVDEYQDVNRIQEMIFSAVSKGGKNITMVGDVKQSIYRFRLADPTIFLEKYSSYPDAPTPPGAPSRILLSHNFRSRPEIVETVNFVFSRLMSPALGEMPYGEAESMIAGREAGEAETPPVEMLVCQPPEGEERVKYEARCAAGYLKKLFSSGVSVAGHIAGPSDTAILLRSMKGKAEVYAAALDAVGIPCSVAGGTTGLFDGYENALLLSILKIIDNPVQDIPLIAALRSPVWRFTANELADIRSESPGSFYSALCAYAGKSEKCARFLSDLDEMRKSALSLGADEVIRAVLDKTGLPAIAEARMPGSSEKLYLAQDYARSCENSGCRGLYGFLCRMEDTEAPKLAQSAEGGVTIMSVHGSKGLEFPVVLLCDLAHRFNMEDTRRPLLIHRELGVGAKFMDSERGIEYPTLARQAVAEKIRNESLSEEMRVLYVAMTRAREKLAMFFSVKDIEDKKAKLRLTLTDPPEPDALEDCSTVQDWLLSAFLCRPDFSYTLLMPSGEGVEAELASVSETAPAGLCDDIRRSLTWKGGGDGSALPSKVTATSLKGGFFAAEAAEAAEGAAEHPAISDTQHDYLRRPGFVTGQTGLTPAERGTAAHMAMQLVDFSKCATLEGISGEIKRLKDARLLSSEQAESVPPELLLGFFRSALGKRAVKSEKIRREFKFSVLMPAEKIYGRGSGDVLMQGVIDLFFEEDGEIVLVDFKSDRVTAKTRLARAAVYEGQLAAYAEALERITGMRVKERRLFFFACDGGAE